MFWIPMLAWVAAGVIALVVLGYCAYEIAWKVRRLRRDIGSLALLGARASGLQEELAAAQERVRRLGTH